MALASVSINNALNLAAANTGSRQLPCPLRQASFHGSSVATCSQRPRGQQQGRRSRLHATTVLAASDAPWANQPKARWGPMAAGDRPQAACWRSRRQRVPPALQPSGRLLPAG